MWYLNSLIGIWLRIQQKAWIRIQIQRSELSPLKRNVKAIFVHQTNNIFLPSEEAVAGYLTSLKDSLWPEGKRAGTRPRYKKNPFGPYPPWDFVTMLQSWCVLEEKNFLRNALFD